MCVQGAADDEKNQVSVRASGRMFGNAHSFAGVSYRGCAKAAQGYARFVDNRCSGRLSGVALHKPAAAR
jgi:hypothetical protein